MEEKNLQNEMPAAEQQPENIQPVREPGHAGRPRWGLTVVPAVICIALLCGVLWFMNRETQKVNKFIDGQLERQAAEEEQRNSYQEDGFVVMDEYEIRSTRQISDAYLSGDDSALSDRDKETLKTAAGILAEVTGEGMSVYEKEKAVYDWMFQNIRMGSSTTVTLPSRFSDSDFTPQGVLETREAVCVGYATTFRMFMEMLGQECHIVHNETHSWDLVKLDDEKWYHVDVYSDVSGRTQYQNFNMTDAVARNGHSWDGSALPAADGAKYTYAAQNHKQIGSIYDLPALAKKAVDEGQRTLYYSFKEDIGEEQLKIVDAMVGGINTALSMSGNDSVYLSGAWYLDEKETYILGLFVADYNSQEEDGQISEEAREKINGQIQDVFGVDISASDYSDFSDGDSAG